MDIPVVLPSSHPWVGQWHHDWLPNRSPVRQGLGDDAFQKVGSCCSLFDHLMPDFSQGREQLIEQWLLNPRWLMILGDYTTQIYPIWGYLGIMIIQ